MRLLRLENRNNKIINFGWLKSELRWCSSAKHAGLSSPRPGFKSPAEHSWLFSCEEGKQCDKNPVLKNAPYRA